MSPVADETADPYLLRASWRKSRYSNPHGNCVELANLPDGTIAVRDSRYPQGPALIHSRPTFVAFLAGVKGGDFDGPADCLGR